MSVDTSRLTSVCGYLTCGDTAIGHSAAYVLMSCAEQLHSCMIWFSRRQPPQRYQNTLACDSGFESQQTSNPGYDLTARTFCPSMSCIAVVETSRKCYSACLAEAYAGYDSPTVAPTPAGRTNCKLEEYISICRRNMKNPRMCSQRFTVLRSFLAILSALLGWHVRAKLGIEFTPSYRLSEVTGTTQ